MKVNPEIVAAMVSFEKINGLGIGLYSQRFIIENGYELTDDQIVALTAALKKFVDEYLTGITVEKVQKPHDVNLDKILKSIFN